MPTDTPKPLVEAMPPHLTDPCERAAYVSAKLQAALGMSGLAAQLVYYVVEHDLRLQRDHAKQRAFYETVDPRAAPPPARHPGVGHAEP